MDDLDYDYNIMSEEWVLVEGVSSRGRRTVQRRPGVAPHSQPNPQVSLLSPGSRFASQQGLEEGGQG